MYLLLRLQNEYRVIESEKSKLKEETLVNCTNGPEFQLYRWPVNGNSSQADKHINRVDDMAFPSALFENCLKPFSTAFFQMYNR